jgi:hypothetical protein
MAGFEDIIGTTFAGDSIFGAEIALGGYPGYPIVGADAAAAMAVQDANKNAMLRQLASRHAAAVMPRPVTKAREYPLGFPTTTLAAGFTTNISTSPQVPFRGRRLVVPSDIAGALLINDLKVGKNSMFAASGPVPARMFSEFGVGVDLNLDTAQISQQITLNVTNSSGAAVTFNAALIGTAVE